MTSSNPDLFYDRQSYGLTPWQDHLSSDLDEQGGCGPIATMGFGAEWQDLRATPSRQQQSHIPCFNRIVRQGGEKWADSDSYGEDPGVVRSHAEVPVDTHPIGLGGHERLETMDYGAESQGLRTALQQQSLVGQGGRGPIATMGFGIESQGLRATRQQQQSLVEQGGHGPITSMGFDAESQGLYATPSRQQQGGGGWADSYGVASQGPDVVRSHAQMSVATHLVGQGGYGRVEAVGYGPTSQGQMDFRRTFSPTYNHVVAQGHYGRAIVLQGAGTAYEQGQGDFRQPSSNHFVEEGSYLGHISVPQCPGPGNTISTPNDIHDQGQTPHPIFNNPVGQGRNQPAGTVGYVVASRGRNITREQNQPVFAFNHSTRQGGCGWAETLGHPVTSQGPNTTWEQYPTLSPSHPKHGWLRQGGHGRATAGSYVVPISTHNRDSRLANVPTQLQSDELQGCCANSSLSLCVGAGKDSLTLPEIKQDEHLNSWFIYCVDNKFHIR